MMNEEMVKILGIESSCDDTGAAVLNNHFLISNVIAGQTVHREYGGVVPELASRAHQQNIVPAVDMALKKARTHKSELNAIAFTKGPGLMGSLMVGASFAKAMALALGIPLIEVNHMQGHVLAHFIETPGEVFNPPRFPFLCLTVSGGHTQIVLVEDYLQMKILGETLDDAAGEAFDKAAKILGLPYPGGPLIDKYAREGDSDAFLFPLPQAPELDFSFSGLKTSFLYLVRDNMARDSSFIAKRTPDLCASLQSTILQILMGKLLKASKETGIKEIAIAGGVSANSGLRSALKDAGSQQGWRIYIPKMEFCTDNAAMIGVAGYFKYLKGEFAGAASVPSARYRL